MTAQTFSNAYLDALAQRVLLYDGAMGTQLMEMELSDADFGGAARRGCNEALVLERPDVVQSIHEAYLAAGADVVETDSFMGSRLKLAEYGLGERTVEVNRRAAEIARAACDRFSTADHPRFVAGSMGPTGMLISSSDRRCLKLRSPNWPTFTASRRARWSKRRRCAAARDDARSARA